MAGSTLVCGPEGLSVRVGEALVRLGERVTIIADAPDPRMVRDARAAGVRLLPGRSAELAHRHEAALRAARCLVLLENSDLGNLNAALAARDVKPDLRLVVRMFDADLAHRTTRLLPNSRVISSSYEAAPIFAAAALGLETAPTRLVWGRHLGARPPRAPDGTNGRTAARGLLGLRKIPGRPVPTRPVALGDGQFLTPLDPPRSPHRRRTHERLRGFRRALRAFFDRRLAATLGVMAVMIAISAVVYHAALRTSDGRAGVDWVDAVYFTIASFTTGSNDYSLLGSPWWVKVYASGFLLVAALGLALFYALAADAVLGTRILEGLGVPRGRRRGHVVVIGVGSIGYRIIQHLLEYGVEVAGVQIAPSQWVQLTRRLGVPVLVGDGRYRDSLHTLSVESAGAVVAATNDDLANLDAALTARELNPDARIVVRLFEPELARRAHDQLSLDVCLSVSALAAPAFVAAALGEGVLSTVEHGGRLWLLAELSVKPGSRLDGAVIATLEASGDLHVLAVRDDEAEYWRPDGPERLSARNAVLVACGRERWEHLRLLAAEATEAPPAGPP